MTRVRFRPSDRESAKRVALMLVMDRHDFTKERDEKSAGCYILADMDPRRAVGIASATRVELDIFHDDGTSWTKREKSGLL